MSEWKETTLGEIAVLNYGKSLTSNNRKKGNIPVFSSAGQTGWHNQSLVNDKGIIIGRKGSIGTVYYSDKPFFCIDTAYYIVENKEKYILKYLYYLLIYLRLDKFNEDSAVPGLNRETAYSQYIKLPPLKEQQKIAAVLSCLDAKIDNLRRQNETLEKMAQTLFKHWFIDFEFPNNEGKPYKSSGGVMVDSELGEIPAGWTVGRLKEIITVGPKESIKKDAFVKYVDMKSLSTTSMEILDFVEREFTSGSKFRNNDVLMARITPCLENGKTAFVNILDNNEVAFGSTEFIVLRSKNNCCSHYVYCLTRSTKFRDYAVKNMTGSSGRQRVPNEMIENYNLVIPNVDLIKNYQNFCSPLFEKIKSNQKQTQTITKMRDELLPKLMSGEIRVKDEEEVKP